MLVFNVSLLKFWNIIFWRKRLSVFWWTQEFLFSLNLLPFTWEGLLEALSQRLMLFRHIFLFVPGKTWGISLSDTPVIWSSTISDPSVIAVTSAVAQAMMSPQRLDPLLSLQKTKKGKAVSRDCYLWFLERFHWSFLRHAPVWHKEEGKCRWSQQAIKIES